MNIGLDQALLWIEKKNFTSRRRKTNFLMALCMMAGGSCTISGWLSCIQVMATTWIVILMISANQITLSCLDGTVKYMIAVKGSVRPLLSSKLYYVSARIERFILLYSLLMGVVMAIRRQMDIFFFIRSIFCVIGTPMTLLFIVMTSLRIRRGWGNFVNMILVIVFNVLFVAEQMYVNIYIAEIIFLVVLFLMGMNLFKKMTGEILLSKGVGK